MLSGASKKKIKEGQAVINEIDRQLDNPDTLPEVKEVLIQRKADSQANIDDIVDEEADKQSKMSSEDFAKSQELSKQVEKIDLALQDPNTGESVKADLESQKKAIESEIDEILKKVPAIAKPTFDTEESLTEEIRAAEKEFNETGDSAEYQLKINDLNTRLENLVPVPEDAEIGKPEEVVAEVEIKNEGKANAPTKESVTERLNTNNPFYKKVEDALAKLGLIEKFNPETKTGDVVGGYVQSDGAGGFASGNMYFNADGSIAYVTSKGIVNFDKNGNVISENTKEVKVEEQNLEIKSRKQSIKDLENLRDSKEFKYITVKEYDPSNPLVKRSVKRLKNPKELKESTDKINDAIDKAKTRLAELQALESTTQEAEVPVSEIEKPQRERGSHKIVKSDENTTLDDMTKGGDLVPNDFYDKPQFYADVNDKSSKESLAVIKKAKGNPDAEITIYRSVPKGVENIEEGDWVSLSPNYAKEHGMHPTDKTQDMPVISMKVKAKDIVWDGNDVNEFAYFPIYEQLKPQEDAVQVETAGQVPVQPEATVGEEVEQGKPEAKPEVVTEEGVKAEEVKSDLDIEKRMSEIEGNSKFKEEFNSLETEMEKRERESVFNVSLSEVGNSVDALIKKEKDKPNGFGSFIEKRDASETKEVANRYLEASKLTDKELMQDFSDAVRGNPTTWYADGLKLRESINEASKRGIDTKEMIDEVINVYTEAGYDLETARNVVSNMLSPILKGAKSVNEKQLEQPPAQKVEQLRAEEQAELKAAIPNADQYLTDGKVDRTKITDAKELKKFDKIYDKYDKLITPLLPKKETKAEEVKLPKLNESNIETAIELLDDINDNKRKAERASSKRKADLEQKISEAETELDKIQEEAKIVKVINDNFDKIKKDLKEQGLLNVKC
jgi:hypothetical protein